MEPENGKTESVNENESKENKNVVVENKQVRRSFCAFMENKNAKRELGQYPAILTELAWLIKDLLYGIKSTEKNDLRTCLLSSTEKEPS